MQRAASRTSAGALFGGSPVRVLALLRAAWPKAVGPELAKRTEVLALEGDALRLRVPDGRWRRHLLQMRQPILRRLWEVAGDLTPRRLSFTEGGIAASAEIPAMPVAAKSEPPPLLVSEAVVIQDPDLRARFLDAATRYLARRAGYGAADVEKESSHA